MTAQQKLRQLIIFNITHEIAEEHNLDELYENLDSSDEWDARSELRDSYDFETGIPCAGSRHYECKSVATEMLDGSYVGYNYWYGGGHHGQPENVEWIEDAYDLKVIEQEKLVVVRTWEIV